MESGTGCDEDVLSGLEEKDLGDEMILEEENEWSDETV